MIRPCLRHYTIETSYNEYVRNTACKMQCSIEIDIHKDVDICLAMVKVTHDTKKKSHEVGKTYQNEFIHLMFVIVIVIKNRN